MEFFIERIVQFAQVDGNVRVFGVILLQGAQCRPVVGAGFQAFPPRDFDCASAGVQPGGVCGKVGSRALPSLFSVIALMRLMALVSVD